MNSSPARIVPFLRALALGVALLPVVAASGATGERAATAQGTVPTCQPASPAIVEQGGALSANANVRQLLAAFSGGFETFRQMNGFAGLSIAIVNGQDVLWARGLGCADIAAGQAATATTVYGVGSVTKMFTATMLMQLVDAGMVALSDPVDMYLPGAQFQAPGGGLVSPTFAQLASHTSGLPRDVATLPTSLDGMVQEMQATTGDSNPGTTYSYSNYGYMVLGQVLAHVAGEPYEPYVTSKVLRPLGMTSSGFAVPAVPQQGYATPYTSAQPPAPITYNDQGFYNPAGGLISTAMDMAQFLAFQFGDGTVNGVQVLSAASLASMRAPVTTMATGLAGSAIGWELYVPGSTGLTLIGKDGDIDGFASQLLFVPDSSLGIVLMNNTLSAANVGNTPLQMLNGAELAVVQILQAAEQ